MSRSTNATGHKHADKSQPDILIMLQKLDTNGPPLLEDLERAGLLALLDEMLAWLNEVEPRVRAYVTRRARQGRSRDLDEQMVSDIPWFRLLEANMALLRDRLLQDQP
jgi:hypothetical protein